MVFLCFKVLVGRGKSRITLASIAGSNFIFILLNYRFIIFKTFNVIKLVMKNNYSINFLN